jgi:hypothetical protein
MIKETKIGDAVVVEQTTYYYYKSEEDRKKDIFVLSTSDRKKFNDIKKQLRKFAKAKIKYSK